MIRRNIIYIVIVMMLFFITSCEFEVTTAHIEKITTCTSLVGDQCESDSPIFSPTDPMIYVSFQLKNAPDNTVVTIIWKYTNDMDPIIIDEVSLNSSDLGINVDLSSSLSKPYNDWPTGKYEVKISIDGDENDPHIKYFEIR